MEIFGLDFSSRLIILARSKILAELFLHELVRYVMNEGVENSPLELVLLVWLMMLAELCSGGKRILWL